MIYLPLIVLTASLTLTYYFWKDSVEQSAYEAQTYFDYQAQQIHTRIEDRMQACKQILTGTAGLFAASTEVTRKEFRAYANSLHLEQSYHGVQGVGFALIIPTKQLAAHEAAIRQEGFPNYMVKPPGSRPTYTSIIYLEPFVDRNLRAFGYDMFSEPVRRAAMEMARDTDQAALSGKVTLIQERKTHTQAGMLLYVPVYKNGSATTTVAERRANIIGWLYSPYHTADLMSETLSMLTNDIDVELYDGTTIDTSTMLYHSHPASNMNPKTAIFKRTIELYIAGHRLTMIVHALPKFSLRLLQQSKIQVVVGAGIIGSLLLFALTWQLVHGRKLALRIAQQRETQFKTLFDYSMDAVLLSDVSGKVLAANRAATKLFGYTEIELQALGRSAIVNVSDPRLTNFLARRKSDGHARGELTLIRKDGSTFEGEISSSIFTMKPDQQVQASIIVHDITERKQAQQALQESMETLQQAKEQAEVANLAKSQFLATMSHEIRTPMNGILGMSQMLLQPDITNEKRQDYTRTILSSGLLLLNLLNDILDLSKIEERKIELESDIYEPKQILNEVKMLFIEGAKHKGLLLDCDWTGTATHYLGDCYRLRQMLTNLVSNAIKFTDHGQIHITVSEISRDKHTAILEFAVTDNGIGIAPDNLRLLFTPFTQADSSTTRRFGGTGLGLSIVKSLAQMMGGSAGCDSEPGLGSRFWLRIRAGTSCETQIVETAPVKADETFDKFNCRFSGQVIIAEDDLVNSQVMQAMLQQLGLTVRIVSNGQQVFDAIATGDTANLILMDIKMPIWDGYMATKRIRQWEMETGAVRRPIIAVTASVFQLDRQHCLSAGIDGFLTKPIVFDQLKKMLSQWLVLEPATNTQSAIVALPTTLNTVDVPQVMAILRQLMPLLAENNFGAFDIFDNLQKMVAGTDLTTDIAAINNGMGQLKFDLALKQLHQLIAARGWE